METVEFSHPFYDMWSTCHKASVYTPQGTDLKTSIKGVVFLGLDNEFIWNPYGKRLPSTGAYPNGWVYAVPEDKKLLKYLNTLWAGQMMPIMWTTQIDTKVIDEVLQSEMANNVRLCPVVKGASPETIHRWILNKELPLPYGVTIEETIHVYSINGTYGNVYSFDQIKLTLEERLPKTPSLIILVGQQGSGKTTVADRLASKGYIVYPEKEAAKLQKKQIKLTATFKSQLQSLKDGFKGKSDQKSVAGIVIDATNRTVAHRKLYRDLAAEVGVSCYVGWITRPGWESNDRRDIKIPDIALYTYAKQLEPPSAQENAIRLI
jgi:predicted kinase